LGFSGLERSKTEDQRLVHAKAANVFAGGRRGAPTALVDSGKSAPEAIPLADREVSRRPAPARVGSGPGRHSALVRQFVIARLLARAR
jgi:hypothetical protein